MRAERPAGGRRLFLNKALVLWVAAVIGVILVLPYASGLAPGRLETAAAELGVPVSAVIALSVLQSAILLGAMVAAGLWAAGRVGLGQPLLDAWLTRRAAPAGTARRAAQAAGLGGGAAVAILLLDATAFAAVGDALGAADVTAPRAWQGLLASVYGGVTEEVQLRLFLFSLLALGARQLMRRFGTGDEPGVGAFWTVNVLVALVFGLAHLPAMAELIDLSSLVVVRSLVLNGLVGLAAGFLCFRHGLEMAMLCHFSADIVLHVMVPLAAG